MSGGRGFIALAAVVLSGWRPARAAAACVAFGFLEALAAYQRQGGKVVVVSHSEEHVIRAHYEAGGDGHQVRPDLVFGWDLGPDKRKPHPYPVEETIKQVYANPFLDNFEGDRLKAGR